MFDIVLTENQIKAVKKCRNWFNNYKMKKDKKQYFVLSGCAGSGKTTIINFFLNEISINRQKVAFMAYTGKAAQVLQDKGYSEATTIHVKIYNFAEDEKTGNLISFLKPIEDLFSYSLFVVDECSMLNDSMIEDLLSFQIPILFLGDHNQLKPVDGSNNLLQNPDVRLTEVIRQALGNSIIEFSTFFTKEGDSMQNISYGKFGENVNILKKYDDSLLKNVDQIICGYNKTRIYLNKYLKLDPDIPLPTKGDKMICRRNNWKQSVSDSFGKKIYLTNGLCGICVEDVSRIIGKIRFSPIKSHNEFNLELDFDYLVNGIDDKKNKRLEKFDFGYAITCHSSQGSEYDTCLVLAEPFGDAIDRKRWLYTAITRAKNHLFIVL